MKKKRYVLAFSVLLIFYGVLFILASSFFGKIYVEEHTKVYADFVNRQAETHLGRHDFENTNYSEVTPDFVNFFKEISISQEVVRIKVWNTNSTIIYSDASEIIGMSFPDNENLKKALLGIPISEIKDTDDEENVAEQGYTDLMEMYLPIFYNGDPTPLGVVEIYHKTQNYNKIVYDFNLKFALIFFLMFIISCAAFIISERKFNNTS